MAETVRQKIITNMDTQFQTILMANGYKTDLGNNINWWRDLEKNPLQSSELPAINLKDSDCDPSPHAMGVDRHDMSIECHIYDFTVDSIRKIIADIEKALNIDLTWTNLALDTVLLGDEIDIVQLENKFFGAIVPFRVSFLTKMGDPYTQG